ncbi:MAG TPA: LCP family protein [Acidimicrobiia bacterium]
MAAPRRSWARRGIIVFLIVANVVVFGALGVIWYAAHKVAASVSTIPSTDLSLAVLPGSLQEARTFLVIGSDSRAGLTDLEGFGDFGGQRADVIMLVKADPRTGALQMLSLPRDLKIDRNGSPTKINATFAGGAGEIIDAVSAVTGVPIHHYLQVDFSGFMGIVDAIGGIEMTFPFPARDLKSGFAIDAGTHVLDGRTALAFSRSRHYEELRDGTWVSVDGSDIGRTRRQQDVLMSILTQIDRPSSIDGFASLLDALGGFVTTDASFGEDEIIQLAWAMRDVSADDLDAATLPVQGLEENGISYIVAMEPNASETLAAFAAGEPMSPSLGVDARIEVQNGNGRAGTAALISGVLTGGGFDVVSSGNSGRSDYSTTLVLARPNQVAAAQAIVDFLGYGRAAVGRTPSGVDVVVIVGLDAPSG